MKLSAPQQQISAHPARFRVAACGRRFGKTFLSINELARFASYPDRKCVYVAPSYRMAKQIVWEDLKNALRSVNWIKKINESELEIQLVNNSKIMLRSADNPDSIRGLGIDFLVIDEAADIPDLATTWQAVLRPTLADRNGHALIIGSPKGRNYFYDMWCNHSSGVSDWAAWQFTTLQGGRVSEAEISAARRDLDERTFQQEFEAQWVNYSGLIYYNFTNANLQTKPSPEPGTILHIGLDFNVDPGVASIGLQHKTGVHIFDEIEIWGTNTHEMVAELERRYPNYRKWVYPDASGAQRRSSANGVTDHLILKNAGYTLQVGSVNPAVSDRIAAVNSALCSSTSAIKLTIDPKCRKLIECLQKQTYKPGTRTPEKSGYDHFPDSVGYLVARLYPIRRDLGNSIYTPQRRQTGAYR